MNKQQTNIAIIGCGRVAGHHGRSIEKTAGTNLVAVCDLNAERAEEFGRDFNVPFFGNYFQMLDAHPEIDVVAVVTPSGMHAEHAADVIKTYKKHVVVEKPTFMKPSDLDHVYELADQAGCKIFPVFQNRYNKAVKRVKKALGEGELGDLRIVSIRIRWCRPQRYYDMSPWRGTYSHDGGVLTNQSIHHIDLLRHLGGEIESVEAVMNTYGADIEVEDSVVATVSFENGAIGVVEATTAARPDDFEASLSIVGSTGLAQIGGIAVNELQEFSPLPEHCSAHSEDFMAIKGHGAVYGFGHTEMYIDIAADLAGTGSYPVSQSDCRATLQLLHAFYRSNEAGGRVPVGSTDESVNLGRADEEISQLFRTLKP